MNDSEDNTTMPGFRFHPTEEELVEFYLRRKIEGKRFTVEIIASLDLYRYDPWELPALAAIGEKEWYFYVPRDRKYRNGDRPNRVTTSGYWKATGADRMIQSENSRSNIGLKKTLVFYSGKAPKGIRSSWIMNEYRLPHQETACLQKAEISLCRVYKRAAGVKDTRFPQTKSILSTRGRSKFDRKKSKTSPSNSGTDIGSTLAFSQGSSYSGTNSSLSTTSSIDKLMPIHNNSKQACPTSSIDDLCKLVNTYSQSTLFISQENEDTNIFSRFSTLQQRQPSLEMPIGLDHTDRLWDWIVTPEGSNKDFTNFSSN